MSRFSANLGFALVLVTILGVSRAADKQVTVGNITVKVLGQSGKIVIFSGDNETNSVKITYDYISEIDTNGDEIKGQAQHTLNTFASQDFTISDPENTTFGPNNVDVTQFMFFSTLSIGGQDANLTSYVYIFTAEGNITVDGENVTVMSGDVKFNVMVESWPFCGSTGTTCQSGQTTLVGQFLDFGIEVKGKNGEAPGNKTGSSYSLGGETKVIIPNMVIYDGDASTPKAMPADYPKLEEKGGKQLFTFRFENFTTSALYDPIVSLGEQGGSSSNTEMTSVELTDASITTSVTVHKTSGKMSVAIKNTAGMVDVGFYKITEVTSDGSAIQTSGHMIDGFSSQDFTFGAQSMSTLQNLDVKMMTYMATLSNSAVLKVHLYVFKQDGNLTNGDETLMVQKGVAKFTVEVSDWKFCGDSGVTCENSEVGTHLDIEFTVSGTEEPSTVTTGAMMGKVYSVGNGHVAFSQKYKKDGASTFTALATGYPMYNKMNNMHVFKVRFEKVANNLMYDPLVKMVTDTNGSPVTKASVTLTFVWCLMLVWIFL